MESESTIIDNRIQTEILIRQRRFDLVPRIALAYKVLVWILGCLTFDRLCVKAEFEIVTVLLEF